MFRELRPAITLFILLTLSTGIAYPFFIRAAGAAFFPWQANGSLITSKGQVVGSALLGQTFSDPKHFWGRLSATAPMSYNAASSTGSNLAPTNPALLDAVRARIAALHASDPTNTASIPVDLVTASASGLDPHITPAAAYYQVARIARARQLSPSQIRHLVDGRIEGRQWGLFGGPRVNVLLLNLDLDAMR